MSEDEKELLMLAAKAARLIPFDSEKDIDVVDGDLAFCGGGSIDRWNPLNDGADALWLAIELDLLIMPYPNDKATRVTSLNQPDTIVYWGDCDDRHDATCLAITRAAAEIGRKM